MGRVADGRLSLSRQRQSAGGPPQYVNKSLKNLAEGANVTLVMLPPPAETEGPTEAGIANAEDREKRLRKAALGKPAPAWNPTGWINAKGKIPATLAALIDRSGNVAFIGEFSEALSRAGAM